MIVIDLGVLSVSIMGDFTTPTKNPTTIRASSPPSWFKALGARKGQSETETKMNEARFIQLQSIFSHLDQYPEHIELLGAEVNRLESMPTTADAAQQMFELH